MRVIKIDEEVKARVGEGGQVTIPIHIRKRYEIKKGDMVVFEIVGGVVEGEETEAEIKKDSYKNG